MFVYSQNQTPPSTQPFSLPPPMSLFSHLYQFVICSVRSLFRAPSTSIDLLLLLITFPILPFPLPPHLLSQFLRLSSAVRGPHFALFPPVSLTRAAEERILPSCPARTAQPAAASQVCSLCFFDFFCFSRNNQLCEWFCMRQQNNRITPRVLLSGSYPSANGSC